MNCAKSLLISKTALTDSFIFESNIGTDSRIKERREMKCPYCGSENIETGIAWANPSMPEISA